MPQREPDRRPIAIIGLGGTISMAPGANGLAPALSLKELVEKTLPASETFWLTELAALASANLEFDHLLILSEEISRLQAKGAAGVVIIQGTDTLEETAFGLELIADSNLPVVFTGAMRPAHAAGSDGPANLFGALATARHLEARPQVLVVMNGELHAARYVVKSHTTALDAFSSGDHGAVGRIHEGRVRLKSGSLERLGHEKVLPDQPWPKVALAKIGIGQDPDLLLALPSFGYRGCVLEAMGGGHVPARLVPAIGQLVERMPVILCSRAACGRVCEDTYGYPGSERDLLSRGVLSGGGLTGLKARVALTIMLAGGAEATHAFTKLAEVL